jgi:hypothetical protein
MGCTVGHRNNVSSARREAVDWMKHHSIEDLRTMAGDLEKDGKDASHIRAIIADLALLERDVVSFAQDASS